MKDPQTNPLVAYKVLTASEMEALEREGTFAGAVADREDGFIHLSTAEQLPGTLDKHFAGRDDLHIVTVDLAVLGEAIRWEPARGGALFPHLYGPLPLSAALAYGPLVRERDGSIRLPVAG